MAAQSGANSPAVSDGKKRALEALSRRFAVTKSEASLVPQHEPITNKGNSVFPSCTPRRCETAGSTGNSVFPSCTPRRCETAGSTDAEAHPAYSELSQVVHENLLRAAPKDSSKGDTVDKVVLDLLQHGDNGDQYIKGSRSMKIDNCLLLDNFVLKNNTSMNARMRALQSHAKRSRRRMSMRQHRKCGSLSLPKEFHNYERFKPMHEMWKEYIIELLRETGKKQLAQCLLLADLHGAIFLVAECKTTDFIGITGIMIRETAKTFGIITPENRFREYLGLSGDCGPSTGCSQLDSCERCPETGRICYPEFGPEGSDVCCCHPEA